MVGHCQRESVCGSIARTESRPSSGAPETTDRSFTPPAHGGRAARIFRCTTVLTPSGLPMGGARYEAHRVYSSPFSSLADADNFVENISTSCNPLFWLGALRTS